MIIDPKFYQAMKYRCIGPFRGGRVLAVAGDPVDQATFYFGACSGGIWKTDDAGVFWHNISDGYFKTASVGAIAVSDSDPNVIYAGMGEACIRSNVTHGDGVYKSTDAGKSWQHLGLENTRHIARVRIHPTNPDLVYVAALGHAFGPNEERGVFRSTNGGATWEKILYKSENAGSIDLSMDPANPRILYASIYQARRYPYTIVSGGPDSGIWRSLNGGDTWEDISTKPGIPQGSLGRIGVAVSPAKRGRIWALIEHKDGGLYRSDDAGETWALTSNDPNLSKRNFYYTHVFAHPTDSETCYVLSGRNWKSTDGGRTFTRFTTPHDDDHDMWIDPKNPRRIIHANDEGATISFNDGFSWTRLENQPTGQFYHVTTDSNFPYRVYGTQQDGSSISIPSRSPTGAITQTEWYSVGGGEAGYVAVKPDDPNIVYAAHSGGGPLSRYDRRTGQGHDVRINPERISNLEPEKQEYRFQWTFPIVISHHDPDVIYATGNHVFRSTENGASWDEISPDLTRNDLPAATASYGAPVEGLPPCTIFTFDESKIQKGVLWAGSDDGLIHVSTNSGDTWENVTPKEIPEWSLVSIIDPSPHDPASAYVAVTAYKLHDNSPYLFKTTDYGKTWTKITNGISDNDFTRVIREDPETKGLLFAGTETGIYVSFDDGGNWQSLQLNLPVVPIHDFVIKEDDLVVATHGRAFWILDDISPLRELNSDITEKSSHIFKSKNGYRFPMWRSLRPDASSVPGMNYDRGSGPVVFSWFTEKDAQDNLVSQTYLDAGENPPDGVIICYSLNIEPKAAIKLKIVDSRGRVVNNYQSKEEGATSSPPFLQKVQGMNRFVWDMREMGADTVPGDKSVGGLDESVIGPLVVPGKYEAQLTVDGKTVKQLFNVQKNPINPSTNEELEKQHEILMRIRDTTSEIAGRVGTIRNIRVQIQNWLGRLESANKSKAVKDLSSLILQNLAGIESELIHTPDAGDLGMDSPVKIYAKFAALNSVIGSADYAPPKQTLEAYNSIDRQYMTQNAKLVRVIEVDIPNLNRLLDEVDLDPVTTNID
ncbi:MAG: Sortilin, neurotensin receptor 3,/Sortilin, neurotensin receptor 3 [Chloroflexi bacterium]|jgi:photosystem II stability/assembly factor-like uncharacterized protein|nr:MAG: Sortilin, neurotensin receptor 3,/Sortilin, neurotensin receptor 3 [Chloroflexota bacterium]